MLLQAPYKATQSKWGFTLAELLISLAILGVIATFTIPKILSAQQDQSKRSQAKEAAAMIAASYQRYRAENSTVPAGFKPSDLLPYMNYVSLVTDGRVVDIHPLYGGVACNNSDPCVLLHSGAILWMRDSAPFNAVNTTTPLEFDYDPDGVYSGSTADSPGKAVQFELYYNGKINSRAFSTRHGFCACDPSWFSWN